MANMIPRNPKNEIIGPTVIRLTEKMSGLYSVAPLGAPNISTKPRTTIAKNTAIRMMFNLGKLYLISLCFVRDVLAQ